MAATVGEVMRHLNNYFECGYREQVYIIMNNALQPDDLLVEGAWVAIDGSVFHDGVYKLGPGNTLIGLPEGLPDETFAGRVWFLRPPPAFLSLCGEIASFDEKTPLSALTSESFGNYSRSFAQGANGAALGWEGVYGERLRPWRRMYTEVGV